MKVVGIIAEYNPFHNGHMYHIKKAREISGAEYVVVAMSGSFVQRGEPAICDKWARAEMALRCGADLVVELPVVYSVQSAAYFAAGGVRLLNEIGVDYLSFGAENDEIGKLTAAALLLSRETEEFKKHLAQGLKSGISFPKAREEAAGRLGIKQVLSSPNNILAVEYMKAIIKNEFEITPLPIKRTGSMHDGVGGATYIRNHLDKAKKYMPYEAYKILDMELNANKAPVTLKNLENAVLARLRLIPEKELADISGVSEGLENRIKRAANEYSTIKDVISGVKTKRYTHSRLRRIMINCLLGITNDDITRPPEYIRVLGLNDRGREVLKNAKTNAKIPVVTKTADALKTKMLLQDFLATDIYALMYPDVSKRKGRLDLTTSPVVL